MRRVLATPACVVRQIAVPLTHRTPALATCHSIRWLTSVPPISPFPRTSEYEVEIEEEEEPEEEQLQRMVDELPALTEHVIGMNRTVKVTKGGRNMRVKALVVAGDGNGRGGFGYGGGSDTKQALEKAHKRARTVLMEVPLNHGRSLYHDVHAKFNSTKVMIKAAPFGSGVTAGPVMELICDAVGIRDAVCKVWGSTNHGNLVRASFLALSKARSLEDECVGRGIDRRRYMPDAEEKHIYSDRLYGSEDLASFAELTGRESRSDMLGRLYVDETEGEGLHVTRLDGSVPEELETLSEPNSRIQEWEQIAERNEKAFNEMRGRPSPPPTASAAAAPVDLANKSD